MAKAKAKAAAKAPAKKKAAAKKAAPAAKGKAAPKKGAPKKGASKAGAKKAAPKAEKKVAPKTERKAAPAITGSPLAAVKARFGKDDPAAAKKALVAAVRELAGKDLWVDALNEDKGLERVSNQKLLRLHDVLTAVKAKFSSRKALIDAIAEAAKRKDEAFRAQLDAMTTARLWDAYKVASRAG